ncbi:hypothetical protein SAMN05421806_106162 [Streptomyces indicus]|uniref:Uncharacterized protein n=1 Tax=Streptomyces indicus TaxID=417292 RepID=A0A1G9AUM9_9ACTN|nr:hypothetical protein SAMN05421806_106162 [Streptomyces indicus]
MCTRGPVPLLGTGPLVLPPWHLPSRAELLRRSAAR